MTSDIKAVPPDFPRGAPASVSGFQAKLAGRLVEGRFVEGLTQEELYGRFDACADLVEQLTAYCHRKLAELPGSTLPTLMPRVRRGVMAKGWDLSTAELDWIMARVSANMSAHAADGT